MKPKTEKNLAKMVKNIMAYKPPIESLKKPKREPSKAELEQKFRLDV